MSSLLNLSINQRGGGEPRLPRLPPLATSLIQINTAERLAAKAFFGLFYEVTTNCDRTQSHIINPLLTSFALSVRESIAFGSYRTDLAPSSLGLNEEPQAILSRTDLALG